MTDNVKPSPEALVVGAVAQVREAMDPQIHRLKRGVAPIDAMLEPVFHKTKAAFKAHDYWVDDDLLATAILLVARLKDGVSGAKFSLGGRLAKAGYSELRFRTLLRTDEADALFTNLQRAVRFCDSRVCPFDLSRAVLGWSEARRDQTRKKLAATYYNIAYEG
jgi:CRISPR type I-E-associated protein CasB/Cse2